MPYRQDLETGEWVEVDAQGNELRQPSAAPTGSIVRVPNPRADASMANEAARIEIARQGAAAEQERLRLAQNAAAMQAELQRLEVEKRKQELAKGQTGGTQGVKIDQAALKRGALEALTRQLNEVDRQFQTNFTGEGDRGWREYLPTQTNRQFDAAASGLSEQALGAFRVPGVGSQSDLEARAFADANKPDASQYDEVNQQRLQNIRTRLDEQRMAMGLGPSPHIEVDPSRVYNQDSVSGGGVAPGGGLGGAITGNTGFRTVNDQALADEAFRMYRAGKSLNDINAMVQAKYPGSPPIIPNREAFEYSDQQRKKGKDWNPFSATRQVPLSRRESFSGSAPAATLAGVANMGSFGGVQALAPEQYAAISEANPGATMGGEVLGSLAPTQGIGMLGRGVAKKLMPSLLKDSTMGRFGRNLAVDATYGAGYGVVTEGDPLSGAGYAALGSTLGQGVGGVLGKGMRGLNPAAGTQELVDAGIPLTVGQRAGGQMKSIEDRMLGTPLVGDVVRDRRIEGLEALNHTIQNRAGEPIGASFPPGGSWIDDLPPQFGDAYDNATAGANVPLDAQFDADMQAIGQASQGLPDDYARGLDEIRRLRIGPAIQQGQLTGDAYQQAMRGLSGAKKGAAQIGNLGFETDYRSILSKAQDALREQMRRGGGGNVVEGLDKADEAYRLAKTVQAAQQKAVNGSMSGVPGIPTPAQFNSASMATAKKYPGQRPFADLLAAAQQVLPSKVPDSGTAGRLAQLALPGAILGGGAAGGYAGGAGGGVAGTAAPLTLAGLLMAAGTKRGQSAIGKALFERPKSAKSMGEFIGRLQKRGLFGAPGFPLLLEAQQQ